jgi:hypothetical protein
VDRRAWVIAVGVGLLAGCGHQRTGSRAEPYRGPTLTLAEVVERVNQNNAALPTLWMRHDFKARLVDDQGKTTAVSGDGAILYASPGKLLLTAAKPGVGPLFELGLNADRYWMSVPFDEVNTMWWGRNRYVASPCADPIPIRPDLIVEVLGVSPIGADLTRSPSPTLRYDPRADVYVLIWNLRAPDRMIAVKEVWYDRQTLRALRVLLYDDNGRPVLVAELSGHGAVEVAGLARDQWPVAARQYDLSFPDSGSWMNLSIDEAMLRYKGAPSDRTFGFPTRPAVARIVQLDEACGP